MLRPRPKEVAALYEQHFPDNKADADTYNAPALSNATSVDTTYDDDVAYDATCDADEHDAITQQREAASALLLQHHYTRHCRGQPDWGIQDPGWHAPRPPTAHPNAAATSSHRLQDWNVRVSTFTDQSGYVIENEDIMYRLPSALGHTLRYHPPFVPGTLEHQLHRCPLSERMHVLHQLRNILLTADEKEYIWGRMDPVNKAFSLSLGTSNAESQTERYLGSSVEQLDYEETLRAAQEGDFTPRLHTPAADMASQTCKQSSTLLHPFITMLLPTQPPFIPQFSNCLVIRRRSI
jgi:hypothetical protein